MLRLAPLLLIASSPLHAQQANWPHWRGPEYDGISRETGWSSHGASEPLWSASLGLGYSNVSILDGMLVTMGFDEEAGEDVIHCLDAVTGETRWTHRYGAEPLANFHGGGTLSTPALAGGYAYTVNRYGRASCLSLEDGKVIWERDYQAELGLKVSFHGFSGSPLVQGDRLIYCLGGTTFQASREDGEVGWRNADLGDGGYGNPVPFTLRGEACLATYAAPGLRVLRAVDGELLHSFDWRGDAGSINSMTPIVTGDQVFVSCAYNKGAALVKLVEAPEAELVWTNRRYRNKVGDSLLFDGHIYGFDEGMLKCIDLEGKERWRVRGLGMGTLSLSDGRLIVLSSDGELVIARANPDGYHELVRRKVLDGGVYWTAPVLVQGRLYLRSSLGDLICRDHRKGAAAGEVLAGDESGSWSTFSTEPVPSGAELLAGHVAARGGAGRLRARQSVHMTGTTELLGVGITQSRLEIFAQAPDRYLLRVHTEFGEEDRCFDGKIGWNLDPAFGNRLFEGDELKELRSANRFHLDLEGADAYEGALTTGQGSFEGTDCWTLDARTKEGSDRRLYFDRRTGLLRGREGAAEARVEFSDWKDFEGILVPTQVVVSRSDTGVEERMVIDAVVWDGVDSEVFARGPKVLRMLRTPEEIEAQNRAVEQAHSVQLGHYRADFPPLDGAIVEVRADDGRLALVTPRGPLHLLPADDEGRFAAESMPGVSLVFDEPVDGKSPGVSVTLGPATHRAPRCAAPEPDEPEEPEDSGGEES